MLVVLGEHADGRHDNRCDDDDKHQFKKSSATVFRKSKSIRKAAQSREKIGKLHRDKHQINHT